LLLSFGVMYVDCLLLSFTPKLNNKQSTYMTPKLNN
jgi:hypothetical protein